MIYLDHAATTPMDPIIAETVTRSMREDFANSGAVYRIGLDARNKIEEAREKIFESLQLPEHFQVIFVSGGTEANNFFIKGVCGSGKSIASLGLEHSSIFESLRWLSKSGAPFLSLSKFQNKGRWELSGIDKLKAHKTNLLCLSHVNNEVGSVNDPFIIGAALKKESPDTRLFLDGVQAVGKIDLSAQLWNCVVGYSISGHKIYGPKGIGVLVYNSRVAIEPFIHGGKQQLGLRSGTLPTPLILGMAKAIEMAVKETEEKREKLFVLRKRLIEKLRDLESKSSNMNLRFNPSSESINQSPAILNFSFPPVEGEPMLHHLEEHEIYVGIGSACSARLKEPSRILTTMGISPEEARCSLRISFGRDNKVDDVDCFVEAFGKVYEKLFPAFIRKGGRR